MADYSPETIPLRGERLCLDFANTVDWSPEAVPVDVEQSDVLTTPEELARWGRRMGLLAPTGAQAPDRAELARARSARDAVYRVFAAIAEDREPSPSDLALLSAQHAEAADAGILRPGEEGFRFDWPRTDPRRPRFAAVADAVVLLADPALLGRVGRCPSRRCGWLFLDRSGRRRWCSMAACGSREKMRRRYARQKCEQTDAR
jgi:predicted RNA-binding Zn ribbon-like protein